MTKITLLQSYDNPILLGSGSEGWIYRISNKYVVKVAAREKYNQDMFHEIKIARLLYSLGISVPEPITCDYVRVPSEPIDGEIKMGFIMEYIDGISWEDKSISKGDNILAHNLVHKEIKLYSERGFSWKVDNPQWIFTKDKKIKLIDFTKWKYKGL